MAAEIADRIDQGVLAAGRPLPTATEIASAQEVALSTARRAVGLLKLWGLAIDGTSRPIVTGPAGTAGVIPAIPAGRSAAVEYWTVTLRGPGGQRFPSRIVAGSLSDPSGFRSHLLGIARIEDPDNTDTGEARIGNYELEAVPLGDAGASPLVLRW